MAYRQFYEALADRSPATVATFATVRPSNVPSVATVANVAGSVSEAGGGLARAEWQYRFEERAAILEYDAGLLREKAERLARIEVAATLH